MNSIIDFKAIYSIADDFREQEKTMREIMLHGCEKCRHFKKIADKNGYCAAVFKELQAFTNGEDNFYKPCESCPAPFLGGEHGKE